MSIRTVGLRRLLLVAATFVLVPASLASAACPTVPTTKAFAHWGDDGDYATIPNGGVEPNASGWSFITSKLALGNDSYSVLPGTHSIALGGGFAAAAATAITPPFCVDASHPYFRFMLRPMGAVGALATFIIFKNSNGQLVRQLLASKVSTTFMPGNWRPSELNPLSVSIPLLESGGTATVQLAFVSPISINGPSYYIDNVLVDPYRRG